MDVSLLDHRALAALKGRERIFVLEYLVCRNKKEAAIRAGYSPKTADVMGCKLVKRPLIARALEKCNQQITVYAELRIEQGIDKLVACLTRSLDDFIDPDTGEVFKDLRKVGPNAKKTVDGIKQTVKSYVDEEGNESRTVTNEIRCMPMASALDMAFDKLHKRGDEI